MKQFISIVCIVLMLAVLLVGCSRNTNVSDNTEGKITETTGRATTAPTTERATTERATTSTTTESTSASVGGSENSGMSENGNATDNSTEDGIEGRLRRGIMGNERY